VGVLGSSRRLPLGPEKDLGNDPYQTCSASSVHFPSSLRSQWLGLERQVERLMDRFGRVESGLPGENRADYHPEFDEIIRRLGFWDKERAKLSSTPEPGRTRYEEDIRIGQLLLGDRLLRFAALVFSEPLPNDRRMTRGLRNRLLNHRGSGLFLPPKPREKTDG